MFSLVRFLVDYEVKVFPSNEVIPKNDEDGLVTAPYLGSVYPAVLLDQGGK